MALTKVQYLRLATGLPIVLPIPFVVLLVLLDLRGVRMPDSVSNPIALAFDALFLFGPIDIVLMAAILLVLRNQSWLAHATVAIFAPWLMIVAAGATYAIGDRDTTVWVAMKFWAADCLKVGCAYVAITFVGMVVLRQLGGIGTE
jgi:uncharacterized protein (DUF2062 family)